MIKKELYQYRKDNHLCVDCGDRAQMGKTRCLGCSQIMNVKQRIRYAEWSDEQKETKQAYRKGYLESHPEKVALYKSRKSEYNQRYKEREKTRYEW